ncbi:MAG: hypothetical protein LBD96_06530 [Treponema sp.]|jgi:hypothetical protein|nr:hypothetical protein [Treponema sp.]
MNEQQTMKLQIKTRSAAAVYAVLCLVFTGLPLGAQPYLRAFTPLRVLRTEYFDIIYPKESEETALRLSQFADRDYEEVSFRLGISVGRRIPVTISPHVDEFNGFMNSMPYPHILLLDTPMSPEWTTFDDSLEKLFLHELTHAVSLSTRSKALNFFHRIFGGWVYPPAFNAPPFMVEGVTVSFESLDGYGRANDPLFRQKLRQDSYENKFLSPHQVSRVSDMNAASQGAWYEYGGLFSQYLQETYGMEKYAELWRAMGSGFYFSFFFYKNGFYHYFEKIYGISILDAWTDFQGSLSLSDIEDSADMIVSRGLPWKPKNAVSNITGMAAAGGRVFVLDRSARHLFVYNGDQEKTELTIPTGISAYDVTASAGGDSLLVSTYQYRDNRAEAVVTEFSALNGRSGRTWRGLYRGSYFRDGVVGIAPEGYLNHIVFRPGNSPEAGDSQNEEVLLRGNKDIMFSNPRPINETWIAFTVAWNGRRELGFYNYDTKQVYTAVTGLPDDRERWEFLRYLQVCEGRLLFGYNHDDRMYKLALIDLAGLEGAGETGQGGETGQSAGISLSVLFTGRDFSGAVALPVLVEDTVYYRGSFFNTDRLMRYPEKLEDISGISAELRLVPWDTAVAGFEHGPAAGTPLSGAPSETSVDGPGQDPEPLSVPPSSEVYLPFKYLNPLYLWLPFPLLRLDLSAPLGFRLDGGGIYSVMIDPPESNTMFLRAAMNTRFLMADFDITWTNGDLGVPLNIQISDGVTTDSFFYRAFRINMETTFSRSLGSQGIQGFVGTGFGFSRFYTKGNGDTDSAYTWDFHSNSSKFMGRLGLSSLNTMPWETFGNGYTAQAVGWLVLPNNPGTPGVYPRVDTLFQAAFEPVLPLRISLYGAWDSYTEGMNLWGQSTQYPSPVFKAVTAVEYQNNDITGLTWLMGGELEFRLFSLNIQKSLSHVYFNRLLGTLAYRTALYDAAGFSMPEGNRLWDDLTLTQSLVLRLGSGISSAYITAAPFKITVYVQAALKLSKFGHVPLGFTDVVTISPYINVTY